MKKAVLAGVLTAAAAGICALGAAPAENGTPGPAVAAPPLTPDARWADLFRPFQTEVASLSPDGNYLAYSVREGDTLFVVIVDAEHPERGLSKIAVGDAATSSPMLTDNREKTPAQIRWMGWATDKRLLVETNRIHSTVKRSPNASGEAGAASDSGLQGWQNLRGAILGVDVDGGHGGVLVSPEDVAEEGFLPPSSRAPGVGRLRLPDQPAAGSLGSAIEPENQPFVPTRTARNAREPRILDYAGNHPGDVYVTAAGSRGYDLYLLHGDIGKLKLLSEEIYDPDKLPLLDRQGRERILLRATMQTPFPHVFDLEDHKGLRRWLSLDAKLKDATGGGFSVSPETFLGHRAIPLAFDEDPDVLYYASNVGRETFGIYSVNVKTATRLPRSLEHPTLDLVVPDPIGFAKPGTLVFDRHTRALAGVSYQDTFATTLWVRPELEALQRKLEQQFKGRAVTILEWDRAERRFLLLLRGPTDAGAFALLDTKTGKLLEFARRAPWLDGDQASGCVAFSFDSAKGHRLGGTLILPRKTRLKPAPVLVLLAGEPWMRAPSEYQPDAEAFASLGLAVLQVDGRGTWGFGVSQRAWPKEGLERARLEDILEVLDALAAKLPLSTKKVAIAGRGRSAYLALRAAQLAPNRFRCVIGLQPTIDVAGWMDDERWKTGNPGPWLTRQYWGGPENLKKASIFEHPEPLERPVLLLSYPGARGGERTQDYLDARRLQRRLESSATPVVLKELDDDYVQGLPGARAAVFRDIEEFINLYLYEYTVKVGETKPVKE